MDSKKIDKILEHKIFGPIISAGILIGAPLLFYGGIPALAKMTVSARVPAVQQTEKQCYQPRHNFEFEDAYGNIRRVGDYYDINIKVDATNRVHLGIEGKNLNSEERNQLERLTGGN